MKKETPKKSKRAPGPFNFCPKHDVFYASCGCSWEKKSKKVELEGKQPDVVVEDEVEEDV